MKTHTFRKRLKRLIIWLLLLFVTLFIFRFIYGYTKTFKSNDRQTHFFETISQTQKNYASKKYKVKTTATNQSPIKVDQKYEKVAEIKTKSNQFENDEKTARQKIEKLNALIQFEQKSGNKGYRRLNLLIGVPPENFDSLYQQLIQIGNVQAKQITKKDKTNEYKELHAKKQSLEKIKASLVELKSKGGRIQEYMDLENRILQIEQELQGLGVSLGDFDDENEFCTVQFSLLEGKEVTIGTMQRVKVALEWTIQNYARLVVALFFMSLFAYLALLVIEKLRILERIMTKK
jgi:predicted  nucleic acid-binding Zn-ribbon protein